MIVHADLPSVWLHDSGGLIHISRAVSGVPLSCVISIECRTRHLPIEIKAANMANKYNCAAKNALRFQSILSHSLQPLHAPTDQDK